MARTGLKLRLRMSLEDFENAKKKDVILLDTGW
jgi:hypothetical protein